MRKRFWISTKWTTAKEELTEAEAPCWNGGVCEKNKKYRIRQWGEDGWARIFALFREHNVQRLKSMHENSTEEEEMKRQQRTKIRKYMTKEIRSKVRIEADNRWWLSCWRRTARKRSSMMDGRTLCQNGITGWRR